MEKNNTSNSSVCNKIRQALAGNPAVRIINRISSYNQEPKHATSGSTSPSSPNKTTSIKTKPPIPQHVKANNSEASGTIPINFDYSPPKQPIPNANGLVPKGPSPFVANSQSATTEGENHPQHVSMQGKPPQHGHGHHGVRTEQQGKKPVDINDTFNEYIQRAKKKIRTVSNIGGGQNNTSQDHESHGGGAVNEKEQHHRDQFSDFIHRAKKKLRTTTIVGKSSSLRKG